MGRGLVYPLCKKGPFYGGVSTLLSLIVGVTIDFALSMRKSGKIRVKGIRATSACEQ